MVGCPSGRNGLERWTGLGRGAEGGMWPMVGYGSYWAVVDGSGTGRQTVDFAFVSCHSWFGVRVCGENHVMGMAGGGGR